MSSVRPLPRGRSPLGRPFSWIQFFPSALWRLMPGHYSALCGCYVALVACPALAVLGASIKPASIFHGIQFGIMAGIGSWLGNLLTLYRGYTGLCTRLYARLYAVFMLFACAKHCIFTSSFTLLIMLALCASHLCDECFRFCFMLALCNMFWYIF